MSRSNCNSRDSLHELVVATSRKFDLLDFIVGLRSSARFGNAPKLTRGNQKYCIIFAVIRARLTFVLNSVSTNSTEGNTHVIRLLLSPESMQSLLNPSPHNGHESLMKFRHHSTMAVQWPRAWLAVAAENRS